MFIHHNLAEIWRTSRVTTSRDLTLNMIVKASYQLRVGSNDDWRTRTVAPESALTSISKNLACRDSAVFHPTKFGVIAAVDYAFLHFAHSLAFRLANVVRSDQFRGVTPPKCGREYERGSTIDILERKQVRKYGLSLQGYQRWRIKKYYQLLGSPTFR